MSATSTHKRKRKSIEQDSSGNFHLCQVGRGVEIHFEPIQTLLRAHLPLSWLSTASSQALLPPGAVLEGEIKTVERWEYNILFARQLPNGGIYAIEKVDSEIFVSFPVQPFVTEHWIQQAAIGAIPPVSLQTLLHHAPNLEQDEYHNKHSRTSSSTGELAFKVPQNRRGIAARTSILGSQERRCSNISFKVDTLSAQESPDTSVTLHKEENESAIHSLPDHAGAVLQQQQQQQQQQQPEKQEIANEKARTEKDHQEHDSSQTDHLSPEYLRQRYLETLYTTKTTLAFYAKGPLNRARARARAPNSSLSLSGLASMYKDSILPQKKIDLKYRESIKNVIVESCLTEDSSPAKRSARKKKLGKDGLWPTEHDYISTWWRERIIKHCKGEAERVSEMQHAITALRVRETQMQIILILEILAIETRERTTTPQNIADDPNIKIESIESVAGSSTDNKQVPEGRDFHAELNLLADKLCIWHSIGLDTILDAAPESRTSNDDHETSTKDSLRNFCTDVIMPFYTYKLPVICKALCNSLAGPELAEQASKNIRAKREASDKTTPGTTVLRRDLRNRSSTLERVLSEEQPRQSPPPALTRSSTLPLLRREPSEVSQRPPSRSNSIQRSASFANREIDLVADAHVTASKKRKLEMVATQRRELEAAIQALRKPNRTTAGKTYMDDVDQRCTKTKRPAQIDATPRACRRRQLQNNLDDEASFRRDLVTQELDLIPSSTTKPRDLPRPGTVSRSSANKRAVLSAIHDTPSKHAANYTYNVRNDSTNRLPFLTPNEERTEFIFATPVKVKTVSASIEAIFSTPKRQIKHPDHEDESTFQIPVAAGQAMRRAMVSAEGAGGGSIYDTLGWNDDYDL